MLVVEVVVAADCGAGGGADGSVAVMGRRPMESSSEGLEEWTKGQAVVRAGFREAGTFRSGGRVAWKGSAGRIGSQCR